MIVIDDLNTEIRLATTPTRIVCLVPSITELLCDLGLTNNIVGMTKFCIHPKGLKSKSRIIGGTKNVNIEKIKYLSPDIIIANKEENDKDQINQLTLHFPVFTCIVNTIYDSEQMIQKLGSIWNKQDLATQIIAKNKATLNSLKQTHTKRVAYLIWRDPWMSIGSDTYIHDILHYLGYENVFQNELRYPSFALEELADKNIDTILLSSEPYPFKEKHLLEINQILPNIKIELVDGEMYSWYGSRLSHLAMNSH